MAKSIYKAEASMSEIAKDMVMMLTVTGVKTFCFRLWLGLQFIKLGAWVSGFGVQVKDDDPS